MSVAGAGGGSPLLVGGMEPVTLRAEAPARSAQASFLEATVLPGRGMNVFQVRGRVAGLGEIDLLHSPELPEASRQLSGGPDDFMGVHSFRFGGALLVPFANRIRGRLLADGCAMDTDILGRTVRLPADWQGKHPGAEKCAIHGLMLASKMKVAEAAPDHIVAQLDAGDFGGHWLSDAAIRVDATLRWDEFHISVTASNQGRGVLPMGIGWHPYFALPSGRREQARVRLPARMRALVNNYDDVFPTGEVVAVEGTPYDFTGAGGAPLGSRYFDDSFLALDKSPEGYTQFEIFDTAARYGVRVTALSPHVEALQLYSPPGAAFVVVEPQFNLSDPFSDVWPRGFNTGMVTVGPGQSVTWAVRWQIFAM